MPKKSVHARAVLTGAAVSAACFKAMRKEDIESHCVHCNDQVIPSWHHSCWECVTFADSRPAMPSDEVQKRLGWPRTQSQRLACNILINHHRMKAQPWVLFLLFFFFFTFCVQGFRGILPLCVNACACIQEMSLRCALLCL